MVEVRLCPRGYARCRSSGAAAALTGALAVVLVRGLKRLPIHFAQNQLGHYGAAAALGELAAHARICGQRTSLVGHPTEVGQGG